MVIRLVAEGMFQVVSYLWDPGLVSLHAVSDALIAASYLSIALALLYVIRTRRDMPFSWLFLLFGVSLLAGGATHFMSVINIWHPTRWIAGGVKAFTALASVSTALLLAKAVPSLLAVPSPRQLEDANETLKQEVMERQRAEDALRIAQVDLEREVRARTAELAAANQALQHSETRLAGIIGSAMDALITVNEQQRIVMFNAAAERMFGIPAEEAMGQPLDRFLPEKFHRVHLEHILAFGETSGTSGSISTSGILAALRADGEEFPIEATISQLAIDGERLFTVIVRDMTARQRAEEALRESETRLRQSQKMEAVGQLAGGIAHDFNNLLTGIIGHTDLAVREIPADNPARIDLEEIQGAALRAAALTQQLLAFSRKQVLEFKQLNLNEVVTGVGGMLRRLIGEDVTVLTHLDGSLGQIRADPGQVEQVVMNLVVNARDAMPEGGRLTIETRNVDTEGLTIEGFGLPAGRYVMLAVSDSGIGMTPEVQSHIFEPFFTTKDIGKGTGLGLATVYGIVTQSSGHVTVYSEPGSGATFKVYFPRVADDSSAALEIAKQSEVVGGRETLLLVEDNEMVRGLAQRVLVEHGYTVLVAHDGQEAIKVSARFAGPIHILLTDVIMPGFNGRKVVERLRPERPDMQVLYMSGYTDSTVLEQGVEEGTAFLQKPFTPDGLLRKVRDVLDGAR